MPPLVGQSDNPAVPAVQAVDTLISESPYFHTDGAGRSANWSMAPDVLRFLWSCLKPSMPTLETGAGQTTVTFAIAGTHHVCVTPQRAEAERIRSYCRDHGIEDTITFIHDSSDIALASGRGIPEVMEFVLIDGAHRFPFPILDWHFTERKVPIGGIVALDDYLTPSVRILHDFLLDEDEWELIQLFWGTSFFRRKGHRPIEFGDDDYHMSQNMNKPRRHPLRHPRYFARGLRSRVEAFLSRLNNHGASSSL